MSDRIPAIQHTEELIVATARLITEHTLRYGGLHASNPDRLILLSSSAVPQEPARAGAGSGQLIFNNACRTCHTTKEGDNRLGPNLHMICVALCRSCVFSHLSPLLDRKTESRRFGSERRAGTKLGFAS